MPLKSGVSLVHLEEDVVVFVANTNTDPVPVRIVLDGGGGGVGEFVQVTNEVEVKNDANNPLTVAGQVLVTNQLVPRNFDAIDLTYNLDGDVATATYRSAGSVVATLVLTYTNKRLVSVARV
jgi:hypothetical protein